MLKLDAGGGRMCDQQWHQKLFECDTFNSKISSKVNYTKWE